MTKSKIIIFLVLILCIAGAVVFYLFSDSSLLPKSAAPGAVSKPSGPRGDINHDGVVNTDDAELIRQASPCNHVDPCWNKVVGKTRDGDNPIYTFDLDINHDDNVNELDTSAMIAE